MTRFMVRVYEAEPNTNTRWKPLLNEQFDDEGEPEHGGYSSLTWALLEAVRISETVHPEGAGETPEERLLRDIFGKET